MIKNLHPDKAPGPDGITNRVIKAGGPALATHILHVTNTCLTTGRYPTSWKKVQTVILCKPHKPDYCDPSAYRPDALLSCLSKVIEAMIAF